jgi:hypothetical protein
MSCEEKKNNNNNKPETHIINIFFFQISFPDLIALKIPIQAKDVVC